MTATVIKLNPRLDMNQVGMLPYWLDEADPRSAREQLHDHYLPIGGGWQPMPKFTMTETTLHYPGDDDIKPLAAMWLRHECVLVYDCSIVAIVQPDGSFEVARMD